MDRIDEMLGMPVPHLLPGLLVVADPARRPYGSDRPHTLDTTDLPDDAERRTMWRDNALALVPSLADHRPSAG